MDLSIIIPSYNTKGLLVRCIDSIFQSLKNAQFSYEVIVVDNASKDGTRELLNKKYPQVIKILNNENVGYGKANNQGIKKARGTYLLLLNSDIAVVDDAIEKLYTYVTVHPSAFAGGKLLNEDRSPQASCGPMYSLPVVALMLFAKGDDFGITRYSPDSDQPVDWVSGACLMGKKQSFLDVGLFDEDIFMYMEEIDLLYRAKQTGHTVYFVADCRFIHTGAASSGNRRAPVVNIYRGLLYFYRKHRSIIEQQALMVLLKLKAWVVIALAKITRNKELAAIYEEAVGMV